jgi:hypothetical protein
MPGSNVPFKEFSIEIGYDYHGGVTSAYRHLWILPESSDDAPVAGIFVLFLDEHEPALGIGYYNPDDQWAVGFGLNRDFDSVYEQLKSEKDLLFRWYADEELDKNNHNKMVWFQISSEDVTNAKLVAQGERLLQRDKLPTLRRK